MATKTSNTKRTKRDEIRELAENDLETFIRVVHPQRVLGNIHIELLRWWTNEEVSGSHTMVLLPRDHAKSAMAAYKVAWLITRNPAIRVLYLSSTSKLAIKQLKFIKDILTSDIYRTYWPEMVNAEESKREKWTETEIAVDHPIRKAEAIRDPTVFVGGMNTTFVGMHCDHSMYDDIVVRENSNTEEARDKVKTQYSLLASIESGECKVDVIGTRTHFKDLYNDMMEMTIEEYDQDGEIVKSQPLFTIFQRQVEDRGDGSGQYLWPRQQRYDGKWFGFDASILAKKKAQYIDKTQFRAQYYNDPNDPESAGINRDVFQYFDRKFLRREAGRWYYKGSRLNVFAAVDFAYSLAKRADSTAIVVVGVDKDHNYYILDIDRFKTDQINEYYKRILALHQKWDFRKIRAEVTAAQAIIVKDLRTNYIAKNGLALTIDEFRPTRHIGTKEERMEATLYPRYQNRQMWHYEGGYCQLLEEELTQQNPSHDDIKDALTAAIDVSVAPSNRASNVISFNDKMKTMSHNRFGGIA